MVLNFHLVEFHPLKKHFTVTLMLTLPAGPTPDTLPPRRKMRTGRRRRGLGTELGLEGAWVWRPA
jgi:hypothetical protein